MQAQLSAEMKAPHSRANDAFLDDHNYCISSRKPVIKAVGPPPDIDDQPEQIITQIKTLKQTDEIIILSSDDEEPPAKSKEIVQKRNSAITALVQACAQESVICLDNLLPVKVERCEIETIICQEASDNAVKLEFCENIEESMDLNDQRKKKIKLSDYLRRKCPVGPSDNGSSCDVFDPVYVKSEPAESHLTYTPSRAVSVAEGRVMAPSVSRGISVAEGRVMAPSVRSMLSANIPEYIQNVEAKAPSNDSSLQEVPSNNSLIGSACATKVTQTLSKKEVFTRRTVAVTPTALGGATIVGTVAASYSNATDLATSNKSDSNTDTTSVSAKIAITAVNGGENSLTSFTVAGKQVNDESLKENIILKKDYKIPKVNKISGHLNDELNKTISNGSYSRSISALELKLSLLKEQQRLKEQLSIKTMTKAASTGKPSTDLNSLVASTVSTYAASSVTTGEVNLKECVPVLKTSTVVSETCQTVSTVSSSVASPSDSIDPPVSNLKPMLMASDKPQDSSTSSKQAKVASNKTKRRRSQSYYDKNRSYSITSHSSDSNDINDESRKPRRRQYRKRNRSVVSDFSRSPSTNRKSSSRISRKRYFCEYMKKVVNILYTYMYYTIYTILIYTKERMITVWPEGC